MLKDTCFLCIIDLSIIKVLHLVRDLKNSTLFPNQQKTVTLSNLQEAVTWGIRMLSTLAKSNFHVYTSMCGEYVCMPGWHMYECRWGQVEVSACMCVYVHVRVHLHVETQS